MKKEGIFNLYQMEFDSIKNEMLQQQYDNLKKNNKLEKKIILEELLNKGLTSVRKELNSQSESSKSSNSNSQKENETTSGFDQVNEAKSHKLIDVQHILYQDALKLHQLYAEKKKLSPQQKKNDWHLLIVLYASY